MAQALQEHEKYRHQVKRIWKIFWLLAIVTSIEVFLGITHPEFLERHHLWHMEVLNWIFIFLTVLKAYYITWVFMHMEQETPNLRHAVVWTVVFYISYMVFIFLSEGDYLYGAIHYGFLKWDF